MDHIMLLQYLLNINTNEDKVDTAESKLGQNEEEVDYDPGMEWRHYVTEVAIYLLLCQLLCSPTQSFDDRFGLYQDILLLQKPLDSFFCGLSIVQCVLTSPEGGREGGILGCIKRNSIHTDTLHMALELCSSCTIQ